MLKLIILAGVGLSAAGSAAAHDLGRGGPPAFLSPVSVDVVSRIYRQGGSAISRDTGYVARFIETGKYDKVVVFGSSFGALPAIDLQMSGASVSCVVLMAPYLNHLPPNAGQA